MIFGFGSRKLNQQKFRKQNFIHPSLDFERKFSLNKISEKNKDVGFSKVPAGDLINKNYSRLSEYCLN